MELPVKEEISVEDEAVDESIFKDCSKIAFYRRQKQQLPKKSTYRALFDSVTIGKDSTRFRIINEATKLVCTFSTQTTLLEASPRMQGYL
ncbi:neutral alpha-glucosidase C isoform X6 [Artibeus jamaicensis]|uniref:neutral alpha-glucosidase C isoform X6 n=1 Tax=Artibeus jamaicensis TaxID=9417 RepID=UPI00235A997D|nr:neutral alpha-glucosidase C isoform X6 [Artibeus jamaicensis]